MRIGKTNAIFGGGVVYNFVPFVAPENFTDPRKYADYGLTVKLQAKFKAYKQTWSSADIAVEFSDAIASVTFTTDQLQSGTTIELFETVSGVETSILRTTIGTHTFTSGSTKRYMIRRVSTFTTFVFPVGSVWAYCCCVTSLTGYLDGTGANPHLKYVFLYENTLASISLFRNTAITGTLRIEGAITSLITNNFAYCENLTKVIIGNQLTTINGTNSSGAFYQCTGLQVADLGTGVTSIGIDTFRDCTSLQEIICRAITPPSIVFSTFRGIPSRTIFKVPAASLNAYKTATNWSQYASRIYAI